MATKLGELEQYSPASCSCTALNRQQRGLSAFPTSLVISLIQDIFLSCLTTYIPSSGPVTRAISTIPGAERLLRVVTPD